MTVRGVLWGINARLRARTTPRRCGSHACANWQPACFPHLLGHRGARTASARYAIAKSYPRLLSAAIAFVLLVQVAHHLESINWTNSGTATVLQA